MTQTIQTIYLMSASIGILAMIPQLKRLIMTKQSDGLSLTTWGTWACCQIVSFAYAISVNAKAYVFVSAIWIGFYWTMTVLIIKYRKRRSLLNVIMDWAKPRKKEKVEELIFNAADSISQSPQTPGS